MNQETIDKVINKTIEKMKKENIYLSTEDVLKLDQGNKLKYVELLTNLTFIELKAEIDYLEYCKTAAESHEGIK